MITPKQKELIDRLLLLTTNNTIIWERYLTPKSFIYKMADMRYIINNYLNTTTNREYDCISLMVVDSKGRPYENCIGCNAVEYIENFNDLKILYDAVMKQYTLKEDKEINNLLQSLPSVTGLTNIANSL